MIRKKTVLYIWILLIALIGGFSSEGNAQLNARFGKNKVHYKDFEWAVLQTRHFKIYFYHGEEQLARNAEKMAERAYQYLSLVFQHTFSKKIPLIIYASSDDFQQTEVVHGFLGEGIGGVTETLKGRIVIPFLGSYRGFNHVLIHELVHAFQFNILSEERGAFGGLSSGLSIPLWFIEGMAEYLSEYTNPLTGMWLRDAVQHAALPKVKQIESIRDIRAYRFGQSLWAYLCNTHGEAIIGDLLRELAKSENWEQSIQKTTDTSWKEFYTQWLEMVKSSYTADELGIYPLGEYAHALIPHKKDEFFLNIVPAVSPDGASVAFISDRDFYQTIYLASVATGAIQTKLVEGERRGTFENLRFLNTSLTWSPDSQKIAFNAKAGGENAIYVIDIHSRKIEKTIAPDVTSLSFLAWSPTDSRLAFTGTKNGQEDLFLVNLETEDVSQLTNDLYSNRHPAWSPDGTAIVFSTDAGQFSNLSELKFGPSNLALYELRSGKSYRLHDTSANDFTPVWSPDGTMLAFISDRTGICNIYLAELSIQPRADRLYHLKDVRMLTHVNTGIVGLTEDNPALSWSRRSGILMFSGFTNKGWDIFALENPANVYREYQSEVGFEEKPPDEKEKRFFEERLVEKKDWNYALSRRKSAEAKDYRVRLTPEYILAGGGGNNESFVILARLGFSDMLSNHRLTVGFNMTEVFNDSDFLLSYSNRSKRLSYELSVFQFSSENGGTYFLNDAELELDVQRGTGVNFHWPFNKFERIEAGLESWIVSGKLRNDDNETQDIEDQFFFSPVLAYVHDTALYTSLGPLDGKRVRFSLSPALGNFSFFTLSADQRWYMHTTRRSALAFRLTGATSFGENARIFEIGGPGTFRTGDMTEEEELDETIKGTKITLGNIEYRFPLLPKINFLRGVIFWDMALGWTDQVQPFTRQKTNFLRFKDLRGSYGAGIRVPIRSPFGLINLRFDLVQETDLTRKRGDAKLLFSLGNDF